MNKREAPKQYVVHRWTVTIEDGLANHTCKRCGLVVTTSAGETPTKGWRRTVNGRAWTPAAALPACSSLKGTPVSGVGLQRLDIAATREFRDMLRTVSDVCGKQRVKDYLKLTGAGIDDAQEVALVTLHAAVRVHLLDAHEELAMVEQWAAEKRREEIGARSESRGGDQGESSGNRRVQAVGGAA